MGKKIISRSTQHYPLLNQMWSGYGRARRRAESLWSEPKPLEFIIFMFEIENCALRRWMMHVRILRASGVNQFIKFHWIYHKKVLYFTWIILCSIEGFNDVFTGLTKENWAESWELKISRSLAFSWTRFETEKRRREERKSMSMWKVKTHEKLNFPAHIHWIYSVRNFDSRLNFHST